MMVFRSAGGSVTSAIPGLGRARSDWRKVWACDVCSRGHRAGKMMSGGSASTGIVRPMTLPNLNLPFMPTAMPAAQAFPPPPLFMSAQGIIPPQCAGTRVAAAPTPAAAHPTLPYVPPPPPPPPDEKTKELMTLNALLQKRGAPLTQFGALPTVSVGLVGTLTHLCALGAHRHFVSEVTYTSQGVESLVVTRGMRGVDHGERLYYRGTGNEPTQLSASLLALATNVDRQRPVRVLRPTGAAAAPAGAGATKPSVSYRYVGLDGAHTVPHISFTPTPDM